MSVYLKLAEKAFSEARDNYKKIKENPNSPYYIQDIRAAEATMRDCYAKLLEARKEPKESSDFTAKSLLEQLRHNALNSENPEVRKNCLAAFTMITQQIHENMPKHMQDLVKGLTEIEMFRMRCVALNVDPFDLKTAAHPELQDTKSQALLHVIGFFGTVTGLIRRDHSGYVLDVKEQLRLLAQFWDMTPNNKSLILGD
jgi:hypothetical protein